MKSLKIGEGQGQQTYICAHWRTFPPLGAGGDAEKLRATKALTDDEYHRLLIWQRDCGLKDMAESKCLTCPHRRKVEWRTAGPVLVDPHGVVAPVIDIAAGEASAHNRHMAHIFQRPGTKGSHQTAAWVGKDTDPPDEGGDA